MQLDQALAHIDGLLDLITPLLTEDSPEAIAQAMEQLQSSMTAFVQLAQRFEVSAFTPSAIAHMQRISDRLAQMRGHIVKIGAINQQQLQALMPQRAAPTPTAAANCPPAQPPRWHGCTMSAANSTLER